MSQSTIWSPGQGQQGPPGPKGDPGSPGPAIELRVFGDYIQWRVQGSSNLSWYNLIEVSLLKGSSGGNGPTGPRGPAGTEGPRGPAGSPGEPGLPGTKFLTGIGEPTELAQDGDLYLNVSTAEGTGDLWRFEGTEVDEDEEDPVAEPIWTKVGNILGPVGPMGPPGPAGVPQIRSGNGEPPGSLGIIGDFYIDLDNYDIYGPKTFEGWGIKSSLIGPPKTLVGGNGIGVDNSDELNPIIFLEDEIFTTEEKDKLSSLENYDDTGIAESISLIVSELGTKVDKEAGKGLSTNDFDAAAKSKLEGIAAGATANDTDAELRDRSTHTGTQAISTVDGLQDALESIPDTYVTKTEFNNTIGDIGSALDAINGEVV